MKIKWMAFLVLLTATSVLADEPASAPGFLFVIESEIEAENTGRWSDAVARVAAAHESHPEGNHWAAYRKLTGGPNEHVVFLFPIERMAEMDGWKSNRSIVIDALGTGKGGQVLSDLELDLNDSDRLMSYRPSLSRPPGDLSAPRYIWLARVRVAEGGETEFAALIRKLIRAHGHSPKGNYWVTYANTIGGQGSELMLFYGFDEFAELDQWPSRRDVLTAHLGPENAGRLDAALDAVAETTTSLWNLEPALSRMDQK